MSAVTCDLPPELMAVLRELGEPAPMMKECVVLELYRRGLLSSGKAAELLGMNRVAFIDDVENHVLWAWSEFNGFAS